MQCKRFFAVLPALALSTAMVVAQEAQPPTQNQTTQTTVGQPTDTNEPVFKGCISGTKDNYVLTTSEGKLFRLHSDKDIVEHVGKMVEIRGTVKVEGADRPADAKPAPPSELDVADVKNIEGSCPFKDSGAAASSEPAKTEEPVVKAEEQKATVTEPAAQPTASATVSTETSPQPNALAEVKAEPVVSEPVAAEPVSTPDPSASVTTDAAVTPATDTNATVSAGNEQSTQADSAQLPETASPLPLLGLLGFASMGLGLLMRRK